MTITCRTALILASGSAIRQQMLKEVGLRFSVIPSGVDEEALKPTLSHLSVTAQALALAKAKALWVSEKNPDALTIGADQICSRILNSSLEGESKSVQRNSVEGHLTNHTPHTLTTFAGSPSRGELEVIIFDKPGSHEKAEAHLAALAGKTHNQTNGLVITKGKDILWEHTAQATLTMRALTAAEIKTYIAADAPLSSCGAYKLESLGRHLFERIEGDHDVIKGLALTPLLTELHRMGAISLI